eukprot:jgi/Phyca11/47134/gw1.167.1.1
MQAAIITARKEQRRPDKLDDRVKSQGFVLDLVASIDPKLWKFSSQFVNCLAGFYDTKARAKAWIEDRKWLEQDWRKIKSDVALFADETSTCGILGDTISERHRVLANEVISKFASCRLRTEFVTLAGRGLISFANIVGGLCRGWLNDSPIDFCLQTIVESREKCMALTSHYWDLGWPKNPSTPLVEYEYVINPVNMKGNHWGIIIIQLSYVD